MVRYRAIKEKHYHQDIGEFIAWGIRGSCSDDEIPEKSCVYIPCIFLNEKEAVDFAQLCTNMDLSLIHLTDVVDDYLGR